MAHRSKLVVAVLLIAFGSVASASYINPPPPGGFSGSAGNWQIKPTGEMQRLLGMPSNVFKGPGPTVAGKITQAAYRFGPKAARALARGGTLGLAVGAVQWLAENCFEKQGGEWVRTCGGTPPEQSTGWEYQFSYSSFEKSDWSSAGGACAAGVGIMNAHFGHLDFTYSNPHVTGSGAVKYCNMDLDANGSPSTFNVEMNRRADSCPVGWYKTPAGCVQEVPVQPVTPQQIEDDMADKPLPNILPPGVSYPIEDVPSSPSMWWNPTEADPPASQPLRVPQGSPQPVPDTNPQQYRQPSTVWTHEPSTDQPWRMDVKGEDVVSQTGTPMDGPQVVGGSGDPGSGEAPTETPDFCALHPEVVACADLDVPDVDDLETVDKGGPITPDSGWGADNAQCPAARHLTVQGHDIPIPFDLFCQFMSGIRPIIIAMAWLSAAFILVGAIRGGND